MPQNNSHLSRAPETPTIEFVVAPMDEHEEMIDQTERLLPDLESADFAQNPSESGELLANLWNRFVVLIGRLNQVDETNRRDAIEAMLDLGDALVTILNRFDAVPTCPAEPATVQALYENIFNTQLPILRDSLIDSLDTIIRLDSNHIPAEQQLNLQDRVLDDIARTFATEPVGNSDQNTLSERLADAVGAYEWIAPLEQLAPRSLTLAHEQNLPLSPAFVRVANIYGFEPTRQFLRSYASSNPDFNPILEQLNRELELTPALAELYNDLAELYESIDFRQYEPNKELQQADAEVLSEQLADSKTVLDVGFGPNARHLIPLAQAGKTMYGIDLVETHVTEAQNALSEAGVEANIKVADWHNTEFPNEQFDGAYCLGRSFLHNTTVAEGVAFLREMARVIKPNGRLVVDLPDGDDGEYANNRRMIADRAVALGITNIQTGTIIDSPNGASYFDRLVPTFTQFTAMAAACGFEAQLVKEQTYLGADGVTDKNTYWVLTRTSRSKQINLEELFGITDSLDTAGRPFHISIYK